MFNMSDIQAQLASLFGGGGGADVSSFMGAPNSGGASLDLSNAAGASMPGMFSGGGVGGMMSAPGFGAAMGGLQALGSMIQGNKAHKLAKDQFKFQKEVTNANLNNSIKSYNTALEDRLSARGHMEGRDQASVREQIERNRLSR